MQNIRVCTLLSGSSANATYIQINNRSILVDAGCGVRKMGKLLESLNSNLYNVDAIFITHEHGDHIGGLSTIVKNNKIPIIANQATLNEIHRIQPEIDEDFFRVMPTGFSAIKDEYTVTSFKTSHDAAECVGYVVDTGKMKIGVVTDLGEITESVIKALCGCKTIVIESNHDLDMLWNGPYHYMLKKRVAGKNGHLSNVQCGEMLLKLLENGTEQAILAHLSKENNTQQLAYNTVTAILKEKGVKSSDLNVTIAPRDAISDIYSYTYTT